MEWWRKAVVVPARRAFVAVAARLRRNKNNKQVLSSSDGLTRLTGLTKLREDVQSCGYEDVLVMWEMLQKSEPAPESSEPPKPPPKAPGGLFCRWRRRRSRRC
ncbi:hypothetical protein BRADI_5g24595v3 [Brachypodium distachyon]|uniref:Uncharacterized protein n=1 Tax=Brachypodium distachyon TaxID=15368 RepID=A0A0Q3EB37_BRADI|nr:hypothetical protein BRADI_5g24595v3 [Brachypodium distachyon]